MKNKPKYGQPCNQCGFCCISQPCGLSRQFFGDLDDCPALELKDDGSYNCGLVTNAAKYIDIGPDDEWRNNFMGDIFRRLLGINTYCDAETESEYNARVKAIRDLPTESPTNQARA